MYLHIIPAEGGELITNFKGNLAERCRFVVKGPPQRLTHWLSTNPIWDVMHKSLYRERPSFYQWGIRARVARTLKAADYQTIQNLPWIAWEVFDQCCPWLGSFFYHRNWVGDLILLAKEVLLDSYSADSFELADTGTTLWAMISPFLGKLM